jgi:protein gp37
MGGDFSVVRRTAPATFNAALKWKERLLIFTCSLSDFFIEDADPWRPDAWDVIRRTPQHTWLILTKRPELIPGRLPPDWGLGYPNVWLGVSGETLSLAWTRGSLLKRVPAAVRFLSAEPWLEPYMPGFSDAYLSVVSMFDWVIIGGESGPACRPMDIRSARALVVAAGVSSVPVFLKQLGGPVGRKRDHEEAVMDGRTYKEFPAVPR